MDQRPTVYIVPAAECRRLIDAATIEEAAAAAEEFNSGEAAHGKTGLVAFVDAHGLVARGIRQRRSATGSRL